MKKLMIAAAAAAMVGGVYAGNVPQVYDFTATLKATECSGKTAKDVCSGDTVYYRVQKTKKLYGKFWGCECKVIGAPANYGVDIPDDYDASTDAYQSYVFWTSTKATGAVLGADMAWDFLQRVGKNGKNVEGAFAIDLFEDVDNSDQFAYLYGAGYGTAVISCDEDNYIKSMSGNIAGWWNTKAQAVSSICVYCGEEPDCEVYAFCDCDNCSGEDLDKAALFGSYTIKYNASQVKSLKAGKDMTTVAFKKNEAVLATFVAKAAADDGDEESTVKKLEKAYAEAKTAYETATNELAEAKKVYNGSFDEKASADFIATTNDLVTTKDAADKSKKAATEGADSAYGKAPTTVQGKVAAYVEDLEDLAKAERAYTMCGKYLKASDAKITNAKTAVENAKKALYGDATESTDAAKRGTYGEYTNAVASVTTVGSDAADNKKLTDALDAAITTYVTDYKDYTDACDAANLWEGKFFAVTTDSEPTISSGSISATATGSVSDAAKIDGTSEYAEAEAKANTTAKQEAATAAQTKLQTAQIACQVAGGDCE